MMQKIFIKYFLAIMLVTVLLTVLGNSFIQEIFAERVAKEDGQKIIDDIRDRIDNNNKVIASLMESLNENYITRAHALAEIIAQNPNMIYDFQEMNRMSKVLGVDEVHVTDEKGVLRWGNVPAYYGLAFAKTAQTMPFMPALKDKHFAMAQLPQPNGTEGKLFQYISVARQDKPGIVQVGVAPEVLDRALANNRIEVVIADYNVHDGENVIAIDKKTGHVVADSNIRMIGRNYRDLGIPKSCFTLQKDNSWLSYNGQRMYAMFGAYDNYVIVVSFTEKTLYAASKDQNIVAVVSSILLGLIIILAIFILLKRMIISDISAVNHSLTCITEGNLEVVVTAKATPEFAQLSQGINEMVESLKDQMAEIKSQANELEERNKNILSSLSYARRIQNNLLPDSKDFDAVFSDYSVLWEPKDEVSGDIYWIKHFASGTVLCVCDCTGHGTPGALLTMLVATALEAVVTEDNCHDPSEIMWELDQKLVSTLNVVDNVADIKDGADLAILYIAQSGAITMSSANTHLFICNGHTVENIKGQKIFIGEGKIASQEQIKNVSIPIHADNKYYVASDGIFDQIGGVDSMPFGYRRFKQIILDHHALQQSEITEKIWHEFQLYMGQEQRRDDITLMSFRI